MSGDNKRWPKLLRVSPIAVFNTVYVISMSNNYFIKAKLNCIELENCSWRQSRASPCREQSSRATSVHGPAATRE
jgi:hypothetical protein